MRQPAAHPPAESRSPGRALVAIADTGDAARPGNAIRHPSSAFLAHLIATRQHLPQTCAQRRADPAFAQAWYAACGKLFSKGQLPRPRGGIMTIRD